MSYTVALCTFTISEAGMMISATSSISILFLFTESAPTEIYTLSLHDALPISRRQYAKDLMAAATTQYDAHFWCYVVRSEEHTSELQSRGHLVCRLLLEKKNHETPRRHSHTLAARGLAARPRLKASAPALRRRG